MKHQLIGPLNFRFSEFTQSLLDCGYSISSVDYRRRLINVLDNWLLQHQISIEDFNEDKARIFLRDQQRKYRSQFADQPTLKRFLAYLRNAKLVPAARVCCNKNPLDQLLARFRQHLSNERGLHERTQHTYVEVTRGFLSNKFKSEEPISLNRLTPRDITKFIICRAQTVSPATAQRAALVLRCFFRFLYQGGDIHTNLGACIPSVRNWSLSEVPKYLPAKKVEFLLKKCSQNTPTDQRDFAILLLLARLGLRAGEIVRMTLDDIDWDAGELVVKGKGGCHDRLPIPNDVGKALARYLHHVRPHCLSRRVFTKMYAPHEGFKNSSSITGIVNQIISRSGMETPRRGAHMLRHSLATRMLGAGASLTEIGRILRHQLIRTTAIYAKVNLTELRSIAAPWPGGAA
jgi:site-specific recombinase XerD